MKPVETAHRERSHPPERQLRGTGCPLPRLFELLLEANEEINTAIIDENIAFLHELMDYYEKEQIASRKESYVRNIKITFQKIARTTIRNIMNLQSSIDNAFKHEPTYQIKIAKLENLDKKRIHIQQLIDTTENLILHEERRFSSRLPTRN